MPSKNITKDSTTKADANIQHTVIEQLQTTLTALKNQLGEKKFEKRIKKAAKLLTAGLNKTPMVKEKKAVKQVIPVAKKAEPVIKKAIPKRKKSAKAATKKPAPKTAKSVKK